MNRNCRTLFENILQGERDYLDAVGTALLKYRAVKERINKTAAKYVPEEKAKFLNAEMPAAQQAARDELKNTEQAFRGVLRKSLSGLKTELQSAVAAPINPAFVERLGFYRAAQIVPSRLEAEALLKLTGKALPAVNALRKLLDDANASVQVECRGDSRIREGLAGPCRSGRDAVAPLTC